MKMHEQVRSILEFSWQSPSPRLVLRPNRRLVTSAVTSWRNMICWSAREAVTATCTVIVLELATCKHYVKLTTDAEPFTCHHCMLRAYKAIVVQLQSDVENLKSELASMKAALQARTPEG